MEPQQRTVAGAESPDVMRTMPEEFASVTGGLSRLWSADVVVLFDWLMSVDGNLVAVDHEAEKQAFTDLLTAFARCRLPVSPRLRSTELATTCRRTWAGSGLARWLAVPVVGQAAWATSATP